MRPLAVPLIVGLALAAPLPAGTARADEAATTGQIRGTVSYGRHEPAAGAVVVAAPAGGTGRLRMATTGSDGTFAFDGVPAGAYDVAVTREGYVSVTVPGTVVRPPYRAIVEVTLRPGSSTETTDGRAPAAPGTGTASLRGTVRRGQGEPVVEARVLLVRPDGSDDPRVAMTGPDGAFAFDAIKAGAWRIEILGAGLLPLRAVVALSGPVDAEAWLASQPANYKPLPQDLIVPEEAMPPPGS